MGSDRFERAVAAIDAANSEDPHVEVFEGHEYPKELLYGQRMSAWLERLRPDAPEALRLACRAQHVRRWAIPRDTFPMDRRGYLIWRKQLYGFHADTVAAILREVGYDDETIDRVAALVRKRRLGADPDALRQAIAAVVGPRRHTVTPSRTSANGKYHSLNLALEVRDEAERLTLYDGLRRQPAVRIVL